MATATQAPMVVVPQMFRLADKLRIQQQRIRDREYQNFAILTTIVIERQLPTAGISQSRPRWQSLEQEKIFNEGKQGGAMAPFSEWQATTWVNLTLEWLSHLNGPKIAISRDKNDLLLPAGLTPLPRIPDPLWIRKRADEISPRIEQKLESRACGRIRDRSGKWFLVIQPLTELCVMVGSQDIRKGGFGKIKCVTDPATHLKAAMLVNPDPMDREGHLEAYFASGAFMAA